MKCNSCGNEINDTAKFCPYCGAAAVSVNAQNSYEEPVQTSFSDRDGEKAKAEPGDVSADHLAGSRAPVYPYGQNVPGKGLGIAGMVLGIITLLFCWFIFISFFTGVVGIILSSVSNRQNKNGFAKAGLATSITGLVLSIVLIVTGVAVLLNVSTVWL